MNLSVIIPAFNASATIVETLSTMQCPDVEVIVVDDGSTDGTAGLVRTRFPSVRVVSQANAGVSAARNAGIRCAGGEYVVFADADDVIIPGGLEKLSAALESAAPDIVVMRSFCNEEEHYPWKGLFVGERDYTLREIVDKAYVRGSVCGCAFRKKYLEENGIAFDPTLSIAEDTVFFAMALDHGGTVRMTDIRFYDVHVRPDSASNRLYGDFLSRIGRSVGVATRISDPSLRTRTCYSLIQGIMLAGIRMGKSAREVFEETGFGIALPLQLGDIRKGRLPMMLLNGSYSLFYRLKRLKNALR